MPLKATHFASMAGAQAMKIGTYADTPEDFYRAMLMWLNIVYAMPILSARLSFCQSQLKRLNILISLIYHKPSFLTPNSTAKFSQGHPQQGRKVRTHRNKKIAISGRYFWHI